MTLICDYERKARCRSHGIGPPHILESNGYLTLISAFSLSCSAVIRRYQNNDRPAEDPGTSFRVPPCFRRNTGCSRWNPESLNNLRGETGVRHFGIHAAHGVIAQQRCSVCTRQEGKHFLQAFSEIGDGHIRSADEAVPRADDRTDRGALPVGGQRKVDKSRKAPYRTAPAKSHRELSGTHPPPSYTIRQREISKTNGKRRQADNRRRGGAGKKISDGECGGFHGSHSQIASCAADFVLYHQQIGAECHCYAAYSEGKKPAARPPYRSGGLHQLESPPVSRSGTVFICLGKKGRIQNQKDHRRYQRGKKHPFILEKEFAVAFDK